MDLLPIDNIELSHYLGKISVNNNGKFDIEIGIGCFDYGNDEIENNRRNFYIFMLQNADKIYNITGELYNLDKSSNLLNNFVAELGVINLNVTSRLAKFIYSKAFRITHKVGFKGSRPKELFAYRRSLPNYINTIIVKYNVRMDRDTINDVCKILNNNPNILVVVLQVKKISDDLVSKLSKAKVIAVSQSSSNFKITNKIGETYTQLLDMYPPSIHDDNNWGKIANQLL